ncbi:alpha/beta hydrolase [Burkholderia multivorans]|uniref:alpha/beta fold hydrolase n=1 Tax=Burkholderia multivorans TaxID=87883 RepID=UPI0020193987|nr:alpha/beta fold hydrolase [Burkholderia multivorans]MCL4661349.1 alpha/beta hydrolase [Burkholderia multivorans]MCO1352779.1 alpha/beta hydrolase [Burkholderia multivorans]MCO1413374.1 alpha/beta hydrolase [Burkholderia multivorans]MCO1446435.1 alpha/beta hydrolase [Burkholderia multivorans]UQP46848.1 alpha/beta hydrolase [Burkholderia multivorans]
MTNKSTDVPAPGSQSGSSTGSPRSGNSCGSATPSTFVLVHGAWHGGWCWRGVTDILRTRGHVVHAPSLTGLADRSHLLSPSIRLHDHVVDIVNLVKWEDLHDFVLVGHSYGGMVVSGVAQELASRIKAIVYLDAFLPQKGQSLRDQLGEEAWLRMQEQIIGDERAYLPPPPAKALMVGENNQAWVDSRCTAHPAATFEDVLESVAGLDQVRRKVYVLASVFGSPPFVGIAGRYRKQSDWEVIDLPFGHDLMVDAPQQVAEILLRAAK